MKNVNWKEPTRTIGAPSDWDERSEEPCASLSILDQPDPRINNENVMLSLWKPSEEELELLNQGYPLMLGIVGRQHPVIQIGVVELGVKSETLS